MKITTVGWDMLAFLAVLLAQHNEVVGVDISQNQWMLQ